MHPLRKLRGSLPHACIGRFRAQIGIPWKRLSILVAELVTGQQVGSSHPIRFRASEISTHSRDKCRHWQGTCLPPSIALTAQ